MGGGGEATPDEGIYREKAERGFAAAFIRQKEEMEGEFAVEMEELEADYQKQVHEMYFFGYRCCMRKHGIKRDIPSIPPGEEEKLRDKPA